MPIRQRRPSEGEVSVRKYDARIGDKRLDMRKLEKEMRGKETEYEELPTHNTCRGTKPSNLPSSTSPPHTTASVEFASSRSLHEPGKKFTASLLDFQMATITNPKILGEDWHMQLEKICSSGFENK
ncbi:hypothetical protein E3N88_44994 [Mikania micrantha]|uniref:Uncharacterized protein n=1 Tax=Mikania micrantha TaxID=192012 RepID=A0A5N6LCS0_9ASTR|nr:hypothetical protein E3N88_44994 [Mikania micrantha]